MDEGRAKNGILLAGRLLLAACFFVPGLGHLSNISGLAFSLAQKGLPYVDILAALIVLTEVFGPLALLLGLAPRATASALIGATLIATGTLHRFWDVAGPARWLEQGLFLAHLGVLAGLLFFLVSGPGGWSWQYWWKGTGSRTKPAARKKAARPRTAKPKAAPARPMEDEDELADAA
jgi:uncharacterized membrane protein YphA (DoxX/SURF4 family)